MALSFYSVLLMVYCTCRIERHYATPLVKGQNYVYCIWHYSILPYLSVHAFLREPWVWLNSAVWSMRHVHLTLKLTGVQRVVFGASGDHGKAGADQLVELLRSGFNTTVAVDGPAGPPGKMKKGALHMAQQAGIPLVPVAIETPRAWIFKKHVG